MQLLNYIISYSISRTHKGDSATESSALIVNMNLVTCFRSTKSNILRRGREAGFDCITDTDGRTRNVPERNVKLNAMRESLGYDSRAGYAQTLVN